MPEEDEQFDIPTAGIVINPDPVVIVGYAGGCAEFHLIKYPDKAVVESHVLDLPSGDGSMKKEGSVDFAEPEGAWEYVGRQLGWIT